MFKIMLVDDERIVLNGIKRMIEEELELEFPVEIITATNVPQALELLDSFCPDLLLTDIRMPILDGFDLIRKIREKGLEMNVAIITSHADFSYAQQAMRFKVMDFILKPIDFEALKATIIRVNQYKVERREALREKLLMNMRNMMLYDLSPQEMIDQPELLAKLFPNAYFSVAVVEEADVGENGAEIMKKIFLQYYDHCHCFYKKEKEQLIAICNHEMFRVKPMHLKEELISAFGCKKLLLSTSISANSYKALHSLYVNAVQRIFYMRHFGEKNILTEISMFTYQDCVSIFTEKEEIRLQKMIMEYITKIRVTFELPQFFETVYKSFEYNLSLYLENNNIEFQNGFAEYLSGAQNDQQLTEKIIERINSVKKVIRKNQDRFENDEITGKLLNYIRQHYREDISLDDLANYVGLHPNYVCTIFKKNTNQSYLTCLHKERLLVAKKLLKETELTVEQVAGEVGYASASQFARVFKKYEGISPSSVRK